MDGALLTSQEGWLRLLLRHLAGRRILATVEIDDLVQEVYLRAIHSDVMDPDLGEDPSRLRRVLTPIARHTVIDVARALRAAKRDGITQRLDRSDWSLAGIREDQIPRVERGPATRVGDAEQQLLLEQAFGRLRPDHRRVIGLRQLQGQSADEAGRRMGRSATAVHSLYRRALQAWHDEAARLSG